MTKVMLVEDDDNLREIYGARLVAEGYEIISARDGEEALALAIKEKPDLLISDVMMPKISGFDMLDILRSSTETKNIKVIMMTALSQTEDKNRAEKLGADRYLVKSQVTLEDVVNVAKEVLADDSLGGVSAPSEPVAPLTGVDLSAVMTPAVADPPSDDPATIDATTDDSVSAPVITSTDDVADTTTPDSQDLSNDNASGAPIDTNVSNEDEDDILEQPEPTTIVPTEPIPTPGVADQSAVAQSAIPPEAPSEPSTPVTPEPVNAATPEPVAPEPATSPDTVQPTVEPAPATTTEPVNTQPTQDTNLVNDNEAEAAATTLKDIEDQVKGFVDTAEPAEAVTPIDKDVSTEITVGEDGTISKAIADESPETPTEPSPTSSEATQTSAEPTPAEIASPAPVVAQEVPPTLTEPQPAPTATEAPLTNLGSPATNTEATPASDTPSTHNNSHDKRVIEPLNDIGTKGPDINDLLKKELEKEQLSNITGQASGVVTGGTTPAQPQQIQPAAPAEAPAPDSTAL